jgi:hypothetical protein
MRRIQLGLVAKNTQVPAQNRQLVPNFLLEKGGKPAQSSKKGLFAFLFLGVYLVGQTAAA